MCVSGGCAPRFMSTATTTTVHIFGVCVRARLRTRGVHLPSIPRTKVDVEAGCRRTRVRLRSRPRLLQKISKFLVHLKKIILYATLVPHLISVGMPRGNHRFLERVGFKFQHSNPKFLFSCRRWRVLHGNMHVAAGSAKSNRANLSKAWCSVMLL